MKNKMFLYGGAQAKLVIWDVEEATLSDVSSRIRGQGHARNVLQQIVDYADSENLTVRLTVQSFGFRNFQGTSLNNDQLEEFYGKFGFVRDEGSLKRPYRMTRVPSRD